MLHLLDDSNFHVVFIVLFSLVMISFYVKEKIMLVMSKRLGFTRREIVKGQYKKDLPNFKLDSYLRVTTWVFYICNGLLLLFVIYTAIYWNEKIRMLTNG